MNQPRQQPEALRAELIEASLALLAEHDSSLDVRQVCRRVNRSQTAAYTAFGKEKDGGGFSALLAAVAVRGFEDLGTRLGSAWAEAGDDQALALEALCQSYMRFAGEHRALYRIMFGDRLKSWVEDQHRGDHERPEFAHLVQARLHIQQILVQAVDAARREGVVRGRGDLHHALHAWATLHGLVELTQAGQFEMLFHPEETHHFVQESIRHLVSSMNERS